MAWDLAEIEAWIEACKQLNIRALRLGASE